MKAEYENMNEYKYTYRYTYPGNILDGETFSVHAESEEEAFSKARDRTDYVSTRISLELVNTEPTGRVRRRYLKVG